MNQSYTHSTCAESHAKELARVEQAIAVKEAELAPLKARRDYLKNYFRVQRFRAAKAGTKERTKQC